MMSNVTDIIVNDWLYDIFIRSIIIFFVSIRTIIHNIGVERFLFHLFGNDF